MPETVMSPEKLLKEFEKLRRENENLKNREAEYISRIESLKQNESILRRVLDMAPSSIFIKDQEGRFLLVNKAFGDLHGVSPEELIGKTDSDSVKLRSGSPAEAEKYRSQDEQVLKDGRVVFIPEKYLSNAEGEVLWYQTTKVPFTIGDNSHYVLTVAEEITARKMAEMALRESEEMYRLLAENSTDLIVKHDLDGTIRYISPAITRLMGFEPEEGLGRPVFEFFHPEDMDEAAEMFEEVAGEIGYYYLEFRVRKNNGEHVWLGTTAKTVLDPDTGDPISVIATSRDVTKRRKAEEELEDHRNRLEKTVQTRTAELESLNRKLRMLYGILEAANSTDNLPRFFKTVHSELSWIVDAKNFFIGLYDERTNRISFPYFVDEMDDRFVIVDASDSGSLTAEVLQTQRPLLLDSEDLEARFCGGDRKAWGTVGKSWLGVPLIIGRSPIGVMGVQSYHQSGRYTETDKKTLVAVSHQVAIAIERKRADEALRESEERFRYLSEASYEAILLTRDGIIIEANRAGEIMTGYSREELIGMRKADLAGADAVESLNRHLDSDRSKMFESEFIRKNGEKFPVEIQGDRIPFRGESVRVTAIRDITARKAAEAELITYQERLRRMGSEMALIEERERRRIAVELHDHIGQALALSKMKINSLKRADLSAEIKNNLEETAELLSGMIQETRTLTVQLSPPILYDMGLESALDWLCEQVQGANDIRIHFQAKDDAPELNTDLRVILYRAVRELLFNVVKHARAESVKIYLYSLGEKLQIDVIDDGVGFDPAAQDRETNRGETFGLFSIRERLSAAGGRLELSSEFGQGTCATLVVPLGGDAANHQAESPDTTVC